MPTRTRLVQSRPHYKNRQILTELTPRSVFFHDFTHAKHAQTETKRNQTTCAPEDPHECTNAPSLFSSIQYAPPFFCIFGRDFFDFGFLPPGH